MTPKRQSTQSQARETRAVVMFVDVEGFSNIVAKKTPEVLFAELRSSLRKIAAIVENQGGKVNKILGNGMLCYFMNESQSSQTDESLSELTLAALQSALAIQIACAQDLVQAESSARGKDSLPMLTMPLRIGINAGNVYWGNASLHDSEAEVTLVGDTVNLAKRLESSADIFKFLVSPAVKSILDESSSPLDFGVGASWGRRFLQVKHRIGLFEAWECNPFAKETELLKAAQRLVRTGNKRSTPRIPWLCQIPLNATLRSGQTARVVDFSENGLCLEFAEAFARKEHLDVTLSTGRHEWNIILSAKGLASLACDVRWVEAIGGKHWHGVAFVGFPPEQAKALSDLLIQFNNSASEET